MNNLFENWRQYLTENSENAPKGAYSHFVIDAILSYDEDARLYKDIFNQIRAIEGVTIISVAERSQKSGIDQETVRLDLKYIPKRKGIPLEQHGAILKRLILNIPGVDKIKFVSSKKT